MKKIRSMVFYIVLLSILSSLLLGFSLTYQHVKTIPYSEKSNLDYKVYLKENKFYDTNVLGKDMKYIASLIDHIDASFNYTFSTKDKFDYNYEYFVLGNLKVTDSTDSSKVIFEKSEELLDVQKKEALNTNTITIDELLTLNYVKYNEFLTNFKSLYNLNSSNCSITLTLNVKIDNKSGAFEDKSALIMKIPLTNQTVDIGIDYSEIDKNGEKIEKIPGSIINKTCLATSILLFLIDIIIIYLTIRKNLKIKKSMSNYERQLNIIFRKYNRALAKSSYFDLSTYDVIGINTFEDLLNVRDAIDKPILFKEIEKNSQAWFVVIENKIAYRYILKI